MLKKFSGVDVVLLSKIVALNKNLWLIIKKIFKKNFQGSLKFFKGVGHLVKGNFLSNFNLKPKIIRHAVVPQNTNYYRNIENKACYFGFFVTLKRVLIWYKN